MSRDSPRTWAWLLLGGWATQVLVRLWLARPSPLPTANPDEIGYLAASRLLAGRGTGGLDLSHSTFYQGGYALLISPAWWFTDHAATVYRVVQVENALLGAMLLPLGYVLGRRIGLTRPSAFAAAYLAALVPAAVFFDAYALTDAVLPVIVLAWLVCVHIWLTDTGRRRILIAGLGASLMAGWAEVTHSRGILIAAAQAVLLIVAMVRRWRSRREFAWAAGGLVAVLVAGWFLNAFVGSQLYPAGTRNLVPLLQDRLSSVDGWGWTLGVGTGQLWAQVVGTAGLAGFGLVACAATAGSRRRPEQDRVLAAVVVLLCTGIALATAAAGPDEHRVGNAAYGRYLACLAPFLVVVGVARLLQAGVKERLRLALVVVVLTVCAAIVVRYGAGHALRADSYVPFDFPDISGFVWQWNELRLFRVTALALAAFAVAVGATLAGRVRLPVVAGSMGLLFLVLLGGARSNIIEPTAHTDYVLASEHAEPHGLKSVAADARMYWPIPLILDYEHRWPRLTMFDPAYQVVPPDADLVFVAWDGVTPPQTTWPGGFAPDGYQVVAKRWLADFHAPWPPPLHGWVAWRRKH